MPKKGREKNTKNKAKHSKKRNQKLDKLRKEKNLRSEKLKAIIKRANDEKET